MNVLVVGLTTMAAYIVIMLLWLRYDKRLEAATAQDHHPGETER